jgi:gamma-glutamylcyclotransferase (GGCT)/AIG2-like uncharacterized protein YtfP
MLLLNRLFFNRKKEYLFVYGTLKKSFDNEYSRYLRQRADFIGNAAVAGFLYKVADGAETYPALIPDRPGYAYGELYLLHKKPALQTLAFLDKYEEIPELFLRKTVRVDCLDEKNADNALFSAWAYVYNKNTDNLELIETGEF